MKRTLIIVGNECEDASLQLKKLQTYFVGRRYTHREKINTHDNKKIWGGTLRVKIMYLSYSAEETPYLYNRWGSMSRDPLDTNFDLSINVSICDDCNRDLSEAYNKTKHKNRQGMNSAIQATCSHIEKTLVRIMSNYFNVGQPKVRVKHRFVGPRNSTN